MSPTRPVTADPAHEDASTHAALQGAPDHDLSDPVERAEWLEAVLSETFDMEAEDARRVSGLVIDQFGAKDEVLDDQIPNDVRSVFYTLESKRILTFRRIEYEGEDGMRKRGFFWRFHPDGVPALANEEAASEDEDNVYENLPEDCWERNGGAAA